MITHERRSQTKFNKIRRALVQWENQHKYLTWYVAFVVTAVLALRIMEVILWSD